LAVNSAEAIERSPGRLS